MSALPQKPIAGWWSRERVLVAALFLVTGLAVYFSYRLIQPFLSPLAWALALAIVAHPVHRWIAARTGPNFAAGVSVALVGIMVVAPTVFVMHRLVEEAAEGVEILRKEITSGRLKTALASNERFGRLFSWLESQIDLKVAAEGATSSITSGATSVVTGGVRQLMEWFVTFFALFYFFRDRDLVLQEIRSLLPLRPTEAEHIFTKVGNTISATIYGTVMVSIIQGVLGGLMFWWLKLPAPLLWGVVMTLLGIVPILGAFVVWVPAAIFLALEGSWVKAIILTTWGTIVIGLVDNFLYPVFVGRKLQLHTLLVFFAILGGLIWFGAAGIILGPLILAITIGLIDIWRKRAIAGPPQESLTNS